MSGFVRDLRSALRQLRKSPWFTAATVLSLGLGIGGTAAIFSGMEQILIRPLSVEEPKELVNLSVSGPRHGWTSCNQAGSCDQVFSYPMFRDLEEGTGDLFTGIAGHFAFWPNVTAGDQAFSAMGLYVSGSYFPILGLRPALGRLLGPEDDRVVGGERVVVLGHRFWETRLGADPDVVGSTIVVNGESFRVVGVAPPGFEGTTLEQRLDLYVPLTLRGVLSASYDGFDDRTIHSLYLLGRRAPGVSIEQAREGLNRVYRPILREVEAPLQGAMGEEGVDQFLAGEVVLSDGRWGQSNLRREAQAPIFLLFGVTGMVLLIACANVANLLLARGSSRSRELAVRASLGAGRGRLARQLLVESGVLGLAGGAVGLGVAVWTMSAIRTFLPGNLAATLELGLSPAVLLFTGSVAVGAGIFAGLYPALHLSRATPASVLKREGGGASGGRSAARFRVLLATAQIALAMTLLVSAGLFARSLMKLGEVELGMEVDSLVSFSAYPGLSDHSPDATESLLRRITEELEALPGVQGASGAVVAVLQQNSWGLGITLEGHDSGPGVDTNVRTNWVGPGYFQTMGIPLLAGREFTDADDATAPRVGVVNQAFARKFGLTPGEVIGRRMAVGRGNPELDIEIVGLVGDAAYASAKEPPPPLTVIPWPQRQAVNGLPVTGLTFYVRAEGDPAPVISAVPELLRRIDPNLPVEGLATVAEQSRQTLFVDRMIGALAMGFAALATLLAAMGLFGVLAFTVAQRTREIGVRIALGAGSREIRTLILGQVGWMLAFGGTLGLVAALGVGRAARSLLFEVQGHDPWAVAIAAVLLGLVSLTAGYLPARKAARVDPSVALRAE